MPGSILVGNIIHTARKAGTIPAELTHYGCFLSLVSKTLLHFFLFNTICSSFGPIFKLLIFKNIKESAGGFKGWNSKSFGTKPQKMEWMWDSQFLKQSKEPKKDSCFFTFMIYFKEVHESFDVSAINVNNFDCPSQYYRIESFGEKISGYTLQCNLSKCNANKFLSIFLCQASCGPFLCHGNNSCFRNLYWIRKVLKKWISNISDTWR